MAFTNSDINSVIPFCRLDYTSFNAVLYELAHGPLNVDFIRLESLFLSQLTNKYLFFFCSLVALILMRTSPFHHHRVVTWLKMKWIYWPMHRSLILLFLCCILTLFCPGCFWVSEPGFFFFDFLSPYRSRKVLKLLCRDVPITSQNCHLNLRPTSWIPNLQSYSWQ